MKIGDTVSLKSGGLVMTVTDKDELSEEDSVNVIITCMWFDPEGELKEERFPMVCLKVIMEATGQHG